MAGGVQLSPLRANLLRPFEWPKDSNLMEIACGAGVIPHFLAEKGIQVDAIEPDRALTQLASLRTQGFDNIRIISALIIELNFSDYQYDFILISGVMDNESELIHDDQHTVKQAIVELIWHCSEQLVDGGKILLASDNRYGIKYLFGATVSMFLNKIMVYSVHSKRHQTGL